MKREIMSDALSYIDDSYISEAACYTLSKNSGNEKQMNTRKLIKIVLIAAVLMSLMIVSAIAMEKLVYSPQRAVEIAQQELKKMQEIGLLAEEIFIKDEPNRIIEFEEGLVTENGETRRWNTEIENPHYAVRSWADECSVNFNVNVKDGVVKSFSIEAPGDESDNRVDDREFELNGKMYYYYDNYDDIFHPDMTLNEFCSKLAEYWGFSTFEIEGLKDQVYPYETEYPQPTGDELLSSLCCKAYMYVSFEGDKRGQSVCITLIHFPGRICLNVDRDHPQG